MIAPGDIKKGRVWHKVTVSIDSADADAVREAIQSRLCCGIQSEDISGNRERLEAYFDGEMDASDLMSHMEIVAELIYASGGRKLQLGPIETVPEEDWAEEWRKSWKPVRVSEGIVVCPSWQEFRPEADETVIYIYPKMAFGTGSHPTTQMCLRLLEKELFLDASVIDIGAGSGILSIAAIKLGARRVTAIEIDPQALENADENCRINRVKSRIRLICAPFGPQIRGNFDLGVCNMLVHIMIPVMDDMTRVLAGKRMVISGISESSASEFKREIEARGWRITQTIKDDEWLAFLAEHEDRRE